MKKQIGLIVFADFSEVIFTCTGVYFLLSYASYFNTGNNRVALLVATAALIVSSILYVVTTCMALAVTRDDNHYKKSHKFLNILKNRQDPYRLYYRKLHCLKYQLGRKFLFGIRWGKLFYVVVNLGASILSGVCCVLSILDAWQCSTVVSPILGIICIVLGYSAYRMLPSIFRSASGLMRYLILSGESLYSVNEDFKASSKVSRNLYISDNKVYSRTKAGVTIIDIHNVIDYEACNKCMKVQLINHVMPELIFFNSEKECHAISESFLRRTCWV